MKEQTTGQQDNQSASIIEDLTLDETKAENIKGGPSDYLLTIDGVKGESRLNTPTAATYDLKTAKK